VVCSIQHEAERTGICKIVPPKGWNPTFNVDLDDPSLLFDTRLQNIQKLQEGVEYGDGRTHTFRSYQAHADAFRAQWFESRGLDPATVTSDEIEQEYWRIVESGAPNVQVEYANDLDTARVGSGFPRPADPFHAVAKGAEGVAFTDPNYYLNTAWNLNNLPFAHGSLLRHMHTKINGINVPWLYCGMLFATFCWHTEDNHMSSVNYQHIGAKKRWYGIPSSHSEGFERVLKQRVPERFRESPDLLFHLTTMVPPSALEAQGVEVYTLVQEPGDIVITFPRAYHAGYSEGFNCNEACNFVLPSWIQYSRESIERYREVGRSSIFSHDRFMFHFGSTQSLEEYKPDECEMLLKELRLMFQEEQRFKKELEAMGLEHVMELSADVMLDDKSMEEDEVRECYTCKHNVFFSGVICTCNPSRLSCLRHTMSMCKCPIQNRTLIQWVSAAEMRYAIRRVQVKIQTLRRQEQGTKREVEETATDAGGSSLPLKSGHHHGGDYGVIDLT
jgi:[histone H3]-trimethyl-L-lysine4 demethylase